MYLIDILNVIQPLYKKLGFLRRRPVVKVLKTISENPQITVTQLHMEIDEPQSTVSDILAQLRRYDAVRFHNDHEDKRVKYYYINQDFFVNLKKQIDGHI